jgi:hypothetical protein
MRATAFYIAIKDGDNNNDLNVESLESFDKKQIILVQLCVSLFVFLGLFYSILEALYKLF